jgi:hypothetical protein
MKNPAARPKVSYKTYRIRRLTLMVNFWRKRARQAGYKGPGYTQLRQYLKVRKSNSNWE